MPAFFLLFLFFLSGASALAYEVVWMRLLSLSLSVTVYAVTTVLCAFMAGLAVGALLSGRVADRLRRPLAAYGIVEIGVAITALATPSILARLGPVYVWLHDSLGAADVAYPVARFGLAFGVLVVPCTLMGATLPLLGRAAITRKDAAGRGAGALYAANTLGAVVGCLAAGFLLVPSIGLWATSAIAAMASGFVGVAALAASWRTPILEVAREPAHASARVGGIVVLACVASGISGFTALGYEVIWTRALEPFTHNSTYAYTAMLATFLFGLGLGSAALAPWVDRLRRPILALAAVEIGIGISVMAGLLLYARFPELIPVLVERAGGIASWQRVIALIFTEASVVLVGTTLLFGATFPLVARLAIDRTGSVGGRLGLVYTANTAGSILGSLVVGFVAIPFLGVRGTFLALMLSNLLLGIALCAAAGPGGMRLVIGAFGAGAMALVALVIPQDVFREGFARRFGELIYFKEEVTDTVMVTEDARGDRMIRYGDGRGTAGTMTVREDRMYAHIPMLLHPDPRRILSICFGVGNSLSALAQHPIEWIDAVELSPGVVGAAPLFTATNRNVLADPRVHLTIVDGRNFLLTSHDQYDVIRLDPPELHTAGIVNLYTREFYELARDHLLPGGMFSIWVNIVMTPEADLRLLVRTLAKVFPYVSVWHGPFGYSWVINGSMTPHDPDMRLLLARYAEPAVASDLASIGVPDPIAFLSHFVFTGAPLAAFAGDGPLVVDDHSRLDFSVPRSLDAFFGFANANTNAWLSRRMDPSATSDGGLRMFFEKVVRMKSWKTPVLPYLRNAEAAGLEPAEIEARLGAHGGAVAQPRTAGGG